MKVMLLAAGKGKRMRPLTDEVPKPLLQAGGKSLIVHQIEKLVAAGFHDFVINHAWLGEQLEKELGDGSKYSINISWSREVEPLETAGGIIKALPLLGDGPFAVVNADVWTDFPFAKLHKALLPEMQAHIVLVNNPAHHPNGDFSLSSDNVLKRRAIPLQPSYTFSGIAVYHPAFFSNVTQKSYPLLPLLEKAVAHELASAELYQGDWQDIGTPERLAALDKQLQT